MCTNFQFSGGLRHFRDPLDICNGLRSPIIHGTICHSRLTVICITQSPRLLFNRSLYCSVEYPGSPCILYTCQGLIISIYSPRRCNFREVRLSLISASKAIQAWLRVVL
ncbi:hypothetical protein CY34DRAFT_349651 [Suillus luteus UH-Slu-Lm8-n1]|uniref:Unplaced genomic scaffold CY34scaffold_226, whole genome shotgun sequence n=1 Tax=Suillus luteus UH-Slu-Lm8-n1 TaxID=930992 RepID=A0A0D0B5L6_9AGAM|nr:hypothetical protein CY34DRAFT_349651 [Suillus luteus UH-Slu-Lm8-n1]